MTTLSNSFLALKSVLLLAKRNKVTTVNILLLFLPHFCTIFTSNAVVFVVGVRGRRVS